MFYSQIKVDWAVMFWVQFLEVFPFLRTSCDFLVIIRQKLVFPTDAKIIEGLTLTRDQMTACIDIFRMGLLINLASPFHFPCINSLISNLTYWAEKGKEGIFSL